MSNERKRRDALASLLPGSAPAPAEDQRAGPGTHGQPSLPAPAHGRGQFLVRFFAAWVTWMRVGSAHGAGSSFSPPSSVQLRGTEHLYPVTLHPLFPGLEVPCTPCTGGEAKGCDHGQAGP